VFTCRSPETTANFISKCIDGIYYGALVRKDTDIAQAMRELEDVTWTLLNYEKDDQNGAVEANLTAGGI
jgi:hypothetical protein